MPYCTVNELKDYLGIDVATEDVLLAQTIARTQAIIDTHTGRTFEATTDSTKYFDAVDDVDGAILYLGTDLCNITSITNGDGDLLAVTDYVTQPRSGTPVYAIRLLASSGLSWTYEDDHENAITIVGRWAYSTTAPADITQATLRLAHWLYQQKDNAVDVAQVVVSGGVTLIPPSMPRDVQAILAPYKRLT